MNSAEIPIPRELLRQELEKRGWTQKQLADIMGKPIQVINDIALGKRSVTPETAVLLSAALGTDPKTWLLSEATQQVKQVDTDVEPVNRRKRLFEIGPLKEMQRRGWIKQTDDPDDLELEIKQFFEIESVNQEPQIGAATRKSDAEEDLTPSQRAWCFRVRHIAKSFAVGQFDSSGLSKCKAALRKVAAYPQEVYKANNVLADYGIRFVVVEPLKGAKVDGVAMWLNAISPVIGVSIRYDRIDSFWHTVFHELSHIEHRDESPLDADLTDTMEGVMVVRSEIERRANAEAADALVPKDELQSFVERVGPLYSKDKIVKFANRIKIHPGIIVGQLQRLGEIGYSANREMLSKVRQGVISASITDGWGHSLESGS